MERSTLPYSVPGAVVVGIGGFMGQKGDTDQAFTTKSERGTFVGPVEDMCTGNVHPIWNAMP